MLLAPGVAARGADAERRHGRISHVVGDRFHVGRAAARLRQRRVRRARAPCRRIRAAARCGRQRSRPGGDRTAGPGGAFARGGRDRIGHLRGRPHRADRRVVERSGGMGSDRAPGRLRGRRRWIGDRHGQGDEPARDERRRPRRLHQSPDRCRTGADAAPPSAHRPADDGRDGRREHTCLHPRDPCASCEDRHQPSRPFVRDWPSSTR